MSRFAWSLPAPPPDAAIEIAADHVSCAVVVPRGRGLAVRACATAPLAPGAVVASLTAANISDRSAVVAALKGVLDRVGERPRRVALVVPDLAAKASLVRFDTVPGRREDLEQLVRWHVKKTSPFPPEDAAVTFTPGHRETNGATDFLVVTARRDVIAEYEGVCAEVKAYAGMVDLATLSVVNFFLGSTTVPGGDWLVVHLRPDYTTIVIMRSDVVIFFRNRPESDEASIADLVHQTSMYYQDRLAGQGFSQAFLGGSGRVPGVAEAVREHLERRLGVRVDSIEPTRGATLADRIVVARDLHDTLPTLIGMMLRSRAQAVGL